jgi:mutator protein MutT
MKVIDVAAALLFRDSKLLITQRYPDAHLGGLWEFPGGKREKDETFEECLVRELREELAIDVKVRELVDSIFHAYPEKTVHLKFFRCEWIAHEPRAIGCPAFAWVSVDELTRYHFPAADAQLLRKLGSNPGFWTR